MVLSVALIFYAHVYAGAAGVAVDHFLSVAAVDVVNTSTGELLFSGSVWDCLLAACFPDISNKQVKYYDFKNKILTIGI